MLAKSETRAFLFLFYFLVFKYRLLNKESRNIWICIKKFFVSTTYLAMVSLEDFKEEFSKHENNPNERLSFFSAFDHSSSPRLESMLCDESQFIEYLKILLLVAMDPWSTVRSRAIKSACHALQMKNRESEEGWSTSDSDPFSLEEMEEVKSITPQTAVEDVSCKPMGQKKFSLLFFDMFLEKFEATKHWYERDGLIRLLSKASSFWVKDTSISKSITLKIALPSLKASELPIREGAAELLVHFSGANPGSRLALKRHFFSSLELLMNEPSEEGIHAVEGNLIALSKVFNVAAAHLSTLKVEYSAKELGILIHLASHSAASIRFYVAEALHPPSEDFFVLALKEILEISQLSCLEDKWTLCETMLVIINQHLCYYLEHPCVSFSRCVFHLRSSVIFSMNQVGVSILVILLSGINSSVFEVKRISTQVLPNWIQFYIRNVGSMYGIFELYHSLSNESLLGSTDDSKLDASHRLRKPARQEFDKHALPFFWWCLVLYVTTRQRRLRPFERRVIKFNTKKRLYIPLLQILPSTAHVVFLLMSTYFPHLCSLSIRKQIMRKESWHSILESNGQEYIYFGIDFVLMMRQKGINVCSLIEVWATALDGLMSHQQCILLTMIIEAIRFYEDEEEEKCSSSCHREEEWEKKQREGERRPFSFAYDYTYKAPAMVDGGEDTALGYTWLRSKFPTHSLVPSFSYFERALTSVTKQKAEKRKSTLSHQKFLDESFTVSIQKNILKELYPSSGTDSLVLKKIRNLMILLLRMDHTGKGNWCTSILEAIFSRLSSFSPNWKNELCVEKQKNEVVSTADDDWDATDEDNQCYGEGFSEEKDHATVICQAVLKYCSQAFYEEYIENIGALLGGFEN